MARFPGISWRGFTLLELLMVSALLVVSLGLALPAAQNAREAADRLKCQNNLMHMTLATIDCADTNAGSLPPAVGSYTLGISDATVMFYILPYLEQNKVYKNAGDGKGNFSVWINNTYSVKIPTYLCPSDASGGEQHLYDGWLATTSYAGNFLVFAHGGTKFPRDIKDGLSNTIFFAERYQVCNQTPCGWAYSAESEWAPMFGYSSLATFQQQPAQARCNPALAQAIHSSGLQVGMGDGSVHTVDTSVSAQTWWRACCPNDGLALGDDW